MRQTRYNMRVPRPATHRPGSARVLALALAALVPAPAAAEQPTPICLQPLGHVPADDVARVRAGIAVVFDEPAAVLPRLPLPRQGWCSDKLCDAGGLIREFHKQAFRRCERVLAVTTAPLLHPFGRAQGVGELPVFKTHYGNVVALLSTHALTESGPARTRELILTALHELGHTFGLLHCGDHRCMMWREHEYGAAADMLPLEFCDACRARLRAAGHAAYRGPFAFWPATKVVTRAERAAKRRARWRPTAPTRALLQRLRRCGPRCTEKNLGQGVEVFLSPQGPRGQ